MTFPNSTLGTLNGKPIVVRDWISDNRILEWNGALYMNSTSLAWIRPRLNDEPAELESRTVDKVACWIAWGVTAAALVAGVTDVIYDWIPV